MKYDLLEQLLSIYTSDFRFYASTELAEKTGVSEKTILKYTGYLKEELKGKGAELIILQGTGSRLIITDPELFQSNFENTDRKEKELFYNPSLRQSYILLQLLTSEKGVDIDDLSNELYISPSLIRSILHDLKKTAESYELKIVSNHRSGYHVEGKEKNIRRCLMQECQDISNMMAYIAGSRFSHSETGIISGILKSSLEAFGVSLSDKSIHAMTLHTLIAINRTETGNIISLDSNSNLAVMRGTPEFFIISQAARKIEKQLHIVLPENELLYLAMHISAKQRYYDHQKLQFRADSDDLVFYNTFLRNIYKFADVDFFEDEELRITLMNHIIPFRRRVANGLQIRKSEVADIRREFPYAYELALCGLSMFPEGSIQPAEISYFAIHLELSLEKNREPERQCCITMICYETEGIFQLAAMKLQKKCADMIRQIRFIELSEFEKNIDEISLSSDLILNTTDHPFNLPVPVLSISPLITEEEMTLIRENLSEVQEKSEIQRLAGSSLFLRLSGMKDREQILDRMIETASKRVTLPPDFRERVEAREKMESTEMMEGIALPHPLNTSGIPDFLAIAVLEEPVIWVKHPVSVVFLISSSGSSSSDWILGRIAKMQNKSSILKALVQTDTYIDFMKIFMQI